MPRANRCFLPGHIWHITHRCHNKEFLFKFTKDRRRWLYWLFEAKKRYGLCVLNYVVTSNHIHLLVKDTGSSSISKSLQLIAGRTAWEYNKRKGRRGAFWEDRYHATAVDSDEHLIECIVYIDMNMVRAGVVKHPEEWTDGGFQEIQRPPKRYRIIDMPTLLDLSNATSLVEFQIRHFEWLEDAIKNNQINREEKWSQSIAVGRKNYVARIKDNLKRNAKIGSQIDIE